MYYACSCIPLCVQPPPADKVSLLKLVPIGRLILSCRECVTTPLPLVDILENALAVSDSPESLLIVAGLGYLAARLPRFWDARLASTA